MTMSLLISSNMASRLRPRFALLSIWTWAAPRLGQWRKSARGLPYSHDSASTMAPLHQSSKRPGLQRSAFAYPTGQCLALLLPRLHPFAVPVTAAGSRRMVCGIYAFMPVRGSIYGSHYALVLRKRSLLPSLSPAGRDVVTVVLRSARRSRRIVHVVHLFHLTASARIRTSRCTHAEGKASGGEPRRLRQRKKRWRFYACQRFWQSYTSLNIS